RVPADDALRSPLPACAAGEDRGLLHAASPRSGSPAPRPVFFNSKQERPARTGKRDVPFLDRLVRASDLEDAAADLVQLDGLEEGLEVSVAESLVALALDDLEEDRPEE